MALDILLTNDDGYSSAGIQTLYEALRAAGENVHIVAPAANQSAQGSSYGGAAALDAPIAITEFSPGNYYVDGRPVTATLVGLQALDLFGGEAPDVVISGTNRGDNIGPSENISGTVNAAVAALAEGVPAIALSAGSENGSYDAAYANAASFLVELLDRLEADRAEGEPLIPGGGGYTVNIPGNAALDGTAVTRIDQEASALFPIGQKANGLYNSTFTPVTESSGNPISEGAQFLEGRLTISPLDGNWSAPESVRQDVAARLDGRVGDGYIPDAEPLHVLLVNDEGPNSPGIDMLRLVLETYGYDVDVVTPATAQPGVGTALTLTDFPVGTSALGQTVAATPTTTTTTALDALLTGAERPDLVISGIDSGPSLGFAGINSGTLAAAVNAVFNYGLPAIAVSADNDYSGGVDWSELWDQATYVLDLVRELQVTAGAGGLLPAGTGLNVNIPAEPVYTAVTRIDAATDASIGVEATGANQARFVNEGPVATDDPLGEGNAFAAGAVTVTPIDASYGSNDLGDYDQLAALLGLRFGVPGDTVIA